jgi:hypothetical protein
MAALLEGHLERGLEEAESKDLGGWVQTLSRKTYRGRTHQ